MKRMTFFLFVQFILALLAIPQAYSDSLSCSETLLDFEESAENFVLETKQIKIPGYPTACNPSIVRVDNAYILSFDCYSGNNIAPNHIGLVWLDNDFNVISKPYILPIKETWQDPRLTFIGNRLYMVFNGALETGVRRTLIAEVHNDGTELSIGIPECLRYFSGKKDDKGERNWVPFSYFDSLMLTYSIVPHRILHPLFGTQSCEDISSTSSIFTWDWGTPRAGTPALLDGDHYLAFFHSSKIMSTVHSEGKPVQHYFIGAYTFDCHPPFAITAVSPFPIVGKNFYHGREYKTVRPLLVVFPCGFVFNDQYIWVVYGKQDHEVWVVKLDKKGLYDSLIPVLAN